MGFLDKMKNLFAEEVEEEPIKSEVIQVEIPSPTKVEENISDNEGIKDEEKVSAPIFFDDAYFKELDQPKKEVRPTIIKETPKIKEEKKQFKPTPIISPIYGVLDKNYSKEDITTKQPVKTNNIDTIDEVRKKAFGTLEDDLEDTLFGAKSILFTELEEKDDKEEFKETDLFDELIDVEDEVIEELDEKIDDKVDESELLDLIDSIYEKGE